MSRKDRRDGDRRPGPGDRRDSQPEDEQQRHMSESDLQESDSLTALKAILSKVSALLQPLQLTQDESIRLVEQLYGSVLEMDVKLAGEADDRRKSSVLAHIQNTSVVRTEGKIVVEYPSLDDLKAPVAEESASSAATDESASGQGAVAKKPAGRPAAAKAAPQKPADEKTADEKTVGESPEQPTAASAEQTAAEPRLGEFES